MSAPRIILASLPSFCQKLSKLMEIWRSTDKNNFAQLFWDTVYSDNIRLLSTEQCKRQILVENFDGRTGRKTESGHCRRWLLRQDVHGAAIHARWVSGQIHPDCVRSNCYVCEGQLQTSEPWQYGMYFFANTMALFLPRKQLC